MTRNGSSVRARRLLSMVGESSQLGESICRASRDRLPMNTWVRVQHSVLYQSLQTREIELRFLWDFKREKTPSRPSSRNGKNESTQTSPSSSLIHVNSKLFNSKRESTKKPLGRSCLQTKLLVFHIYTYSV